MAKYAVVVCCWLHGHKTDLAMTKLQEERLGRQIGKLQAVCPVCRANEEGNQSIFILDGKTLFNPGKTYQCRHGHVSRIGAFTSGMCNVSFGHNREDFVNMEGTIEELKELIDKKTISCHHVRENGRPCGCKLKETDDFVLQYPDSVSIKTTTRVGDLWDKHGLEPVRSGGYDGSGHYRGTKSEKANLARLKRVRERNTPADRHPGKRIDKSTTKIQRRRSKSDVNPDKLTGPK